MALEFSKRGDAEKKLSSWSNALLFYSLSLCFAESFEQMSYGFANQARGFFQMKMVNLSNWLAQMQIFPLEIYLQLEWSEGDPLRRHRSPHFHAFKKRKLLQIPYKNYSLNYLFYFFIYTSIIRSSSYKNNNNKTRPAKRSKRKQFGWHPEQERRNNSNFVEAVQKVNEEETKRRNQNTLTGIPDIMQ